MPAPAPMAASTATVARSDAREARTRPDPVLSDLRWMPVDREISEARVLLDQAMDLLPGAEDYPVTRNVLYRLREAHERISEVIAKLEAAERLTAPKEAA